MAAVVLEVTPVMQLVPSSWRCSSLTYEKYSPG